MGHLADIKLFQHLLNRTNRVAQITVAFLTSFYNGAGLFRGNETARFQWLDMFAHRAAAHAGSFCDCLEAWPALIGCSVFAEKEIAVHCKFSGRQTQHKHFVGDWEIVSDGIAFGAVLIPHWTLLHCAMTLLFWGRSEDHKSEEGFLIIWNGSSSLLDCGYWIIDGTCFECCSATLRSPFPCICTHSPSLLIQFQRQVKQIISKQKIRLFKLFCRLKSLIWMLSFLCLLCKPHCHKKELEKCFDSNP